MFRFTILVKPVYVQCRWESLIEKKWTWIFLQMDGFMEKILKIGLDVCCLPLINTDFVFTRTLWRLHCLEVLNDPDEYPDLGVHEFRISVGILPYLSDKYLIEKEFCFEHPFHFLSDRTHPGDLPNTGSFMKCDSEDIIVSSVKKAENTEELIIKLYNTSASESSICIEFRITSQSSLGNRCI